MVLGRGDLTGCWQWVVLEVEPGRESSGHTDQYEGAVPPAVVSVAGGKAHLSGWPPLPHPLSPHCVL